MGRPKKGEEKQAGAIYHIKFPADLAIRLENCLHESKIRAIPGGKRGQTTADFFRKAVTDMLDRMAS